MNGRLLELQRRVIPQKDDETTPRWVGVIVAVVVTLVVLFVGVLLGRSLSPEAVTTAAQSSVTQNENGTETTNTGPGPTTWLTNIAVKYPVGVGFAHTAAGAVTAAEHYATYLSGPAMLGQPYRDNLLGAIVSASVRDTMTQQYDSAMTPENNALVKLSASGTPVTLTTGVLKPRLISATANAAQVSVWINNISGAVTGFAPTSSYQTVTVDLVWEDNDWKIKNTQAVSGPTPAPDTGDYATVEQFYSFTQNYSDPLVVPLTEEP